MTLTLTFTCITLNFLLRTASAAPCRFWASQVALVVKNPPVNAGGAGGMGSIPGSERSPGGGTATHSHVLAWRIPWTEELGRLQSPGSQRVGHD